MAVLKQTSPTAWPSAPRPKPSSTVPSASTRSAVGLCSGQAELFSGEVMSALHSRRTHARQSRIQPIHMQNRLIFRPHAGRAAELGCLIPANGLDQGFLHKRTHAMLRDDINNAVKDAMRAKDER